MYEYEDYYEPSEFDEKIEELKDYLRESVKSETQDEIKSLSNRNISLEKIKTDQGNEITKLINENNSLKVLNGASNILLNKINKDNIFSIIEVLFKKTFNEDTDECPMWYGFFVNYYNDRFEIIDLLKFAGVEVPKEAINIIFPHEWNNDKLDLFFETMHRHYNCNGNSFSNNLRHFNYRDALNPMSNNRSSYDEIPWQFVLRNPILNSIEYVEKIVDAINKGGNGQYFSKITEYQILDDEVLNHIVSNIKPDNKYKDSIINKFLIENIELVKDETCLSDIYAILLKTWHPYKSIAKMSNDYQTKYAESLDNIGYVMDFFKHSTLPQEEKTKILSKFV